MKLYHATHEKMLKVYRNSGRIIAPVRGFDTMQGAMAWAIKTGRTCIVEMDVSDDYTHKLPDHHNEYGTAFWHENDVASWEVSFNANYDA